MPLPESGYLLLYHESGDEVHADLITEEHYLKITAALANYHDTPKEQKALEKAQYSEEPVKRWFTQTLCTEAWPYTEVKILGTVCLWSC